jgi:prepilin signal peptidase PulO-like enzyme (type II secretory pathway)
MGLCFGSFVGALNWRLHKGLGFVNDRSICEHCKHTLGVADLIPLLSWVVLRGKCRYCRHSIGLEAPVLEVVMAFLFGISYIYWPKTLGSVSSYLVFASWLAIVVGFVSLSYYDIKWMLLPNKVVFALLMIVLTRIVLIALFDHGGTELIKSSVLGIVFGGGIFYALFQLSSGRWIGGGDVKLGFVFGALVGGPLNALLVIFGASVLGTAYILPGLLVGKVSANSKIPFGPFLLLSTYIIMIFGSPIVDLLKNKLLLF